MTEEQTLKEFFTETPEDDQSLGEPGSEEAYLSRRQFLSGTLAGGAAGLAVAAGTGVAVWKITDTQAQAAMDDANAEIARLQGLVGLYEDLEKVGLDAILQAGMTAVALPLEMVERGAKALKSGLEAVEGALISLEDALPSARESILWLETQVSAVADSIEKLETVLAKVLEEAADNPLAEALGDFAGMILDNLPFGLGDRIRAVLDGLVEFVTSVDELVAGINTHILEPLNEKWFSSEDGKGVGALLVDPLVENILDPVEAHLEDLEALADTWQDKLLAPTQDALVERARVREEIAQYKSDHGFA